MSVLVRRYLRGAAIGAEVRTATYAGEEHVVVPVVALVGDLVVRPMHSTAGELVPASELISEGWDGRPVLPEHPENGRASANKPQTLDTLGFGQVFNSKVESGRLVVEAWLSRSRAAAQAEDGDERAQRVIERAEAGEPIEVSVGVYIEVEEVSGGEHDGVAYETIWRNLIADHLAMLEEGVEGACAVADGCGAPRVARKEPRRSLRAAGETGGGMFERMMERLRRLVGGGSSDVETRDALANALNAAVGGFEWIIEVYADDGYAIFETFAEGAWQTWRHDFEMSDTGEVTLKGEPVEVRVEQEWIPVAAVAAADAEPKQPCGCGGDTKNEPAVEPESPASEPGEVEMDPKLKELIGRLVASAASPFTDEDEEWLAEAGEEKVEAMLAKCETLSQPAENEPADADSSGDPVEMTEDEWLEAAPQPLREMIESHRAAEKARRAELVEAITGASQEWTPEELKAMKTAELERLAKVLKASTATVGHSGRVIEDRSARNGAPKPPSLRERIVAARSAA